MVYREKNTEVIMNNSCIYYIDLISDKEFDRSFLGKFKSFIMELEYNREILKLIRDFTNISNKRIEIYIESASVDEDTPGIIVDIIKEIEDNIGYFKDGSEIKFEIEFPYSAKGWKKDSYEWVLAFDENDTYLEDGLGFFDDPQWVEEY